MPLYFRQWKQAIRDYLRTKNDRTLATLVAKAREDGILCSDSRSCLVSVCSGEGGYREERESLLARGAERALYGFGIGKCREADPIRNRILYAICRAEQKRREWARGRETGSVKDAPPGLSSEKES
jgi:hypothetical protein